ncbi:retrovirus-related pol polyprotein from transposon TNT 1-94 [Tanacetum coccineum]|uniref:Retrovirus-related pol polyprotein from transposon TNT 1-94 n=1 Tax=Tanacetum coccineum TaxID=301880 RepID=A0ABQ5GEI6_9ASTR
MSFECNNIKLAIRNDKSTVICAMCKQCFVTANHDACVISYVNDMNSRANNLNANVSNIAYQKRHRPQFFDTDLEVAFRRNTCFVRKLDGVDLLKGNRSTNIYTINLYDMASASLIFLMACAASTKSWLWHQRLSHLNFDTINDLARNNLVSGLPKFKTPQQNGVVERRNRTLVEAARTMLIFSHALLFLWAEAIATACYTQNHSIVHRRFNKTPYELIQGRKPDISYLHVFRSLRYPKNDRKDIGKLGSKGDIRLLIGYFANSCAYRVYNRRTKKIMETMNITFDELSAMAFKQSSSKLKLQSMTSGQISPGLDLTYALSTITKQKPTERKLELLFEAMYDDYLGGQPSEAPRPVPAAPTHQNLQTPPVTIAIQDSAPTPTHISTTLNTSKNVDEPSSQHLKTDGEMCVYALTVSTIEPNNVKEAMTDSAWIESMQENLLQFKRLDVWKLVPSPDGIKPLTLKWLFKNKLDEENTAKPTEKHLKEVKRIFCYLRGTTNIGLLYTKDSCFEQTGFSYADYAGCKDTFKSTSGGTQFLGKKLVSWSSKKPDCTSLSTAESEYVSLSACCAQVL